MNEIQMVELDDGRWVPADAYEARREAGNLTPSESLALQARTLAFLVAPLHERRRPQPKPTKTGAVIFLTFYGALVVGSVAHFLGYL